MGVKGSVVRWWSGGENPPWGTRIADADPVAIDQAHRWMRRVFGPGRWFELDITGWHHVPPAPALVVSNHSGGTIIPDAWGFMTAWYDRFGTERVLHPLAHEIILANPRSGPWLSRVGALRAGPEVARRALGDWRRDLIVMPGGDMDTWRPYRDRYQVCFAGRRGYARLALSTGTPVVPVAHAGAHETLYVIARGERLARWLKIPKLARARVFPVHLSLPYGVAVGPWPHLPPPTTLSYRIGPPIHPPVVPPGDVPEALVDAFDRRVRRVMQDLLDGLRGERAR